MIMKDIIKISGYQIFDHLNNISNGSLEEELLNIAKSGRNEIMVAGQSVVSAIIKILNLNINAPINDIDMFIQSNMENINKNRQYSKMVNETVLFSRIFHDVDYGVMTKYNTRYKVLNSYKKGIINITEYIFEGARNNIRDFLQMFDINSTKAGIVIYFKNEKIKTIELVVLPEVVDFLQNQQLLISKFYTPVHSLIRIYKKNDEFNMLKEEEKEIILPNVLAIENLLSEMVYSEKFIRNIPEDIFPFYSTISLKEAIKIEMAFSRKPMFFGKKTLEKLEQNEKEILKNFVLLKREYKNSISDIEIDLKNKVMYTLPNVIAKENEIKNIDLWTLVHKNYKNVAFEEIKNTIEFLKEYNLGFILNKVVDFMDLYLNEKDLMSIVRYLSLSGVNLSMFVTNMMFVFERFSNIYAEYKRIQLKQQKEKFFILDERTDSYLKRKKEILENHGSILFDSEKPIVTVPEKDFDPTHFFGIENIETLFLIDKKNDAGILLETISYPNAYIGKLIKHKYENSKRFSKLLLPLIEESKRDFFQRVLLKNSSEILYSMTNINIFIEKFNQLKKIDEKIGKNTRKMNALSPFVYKDKETLSFMSNLAIAIQRLKDKETFEDRKWVSAMPLKAYQYNLTFESFGFNELKPIDFLNFLNLPLYYFYNDIGKVIGIGLDQESLYNNEDDFPSKIAMILDFNHAKYIPKEFKCYCLQPINDFNLSNNTNLDFKISWWWGKIKKESLTTEKSSKDQKGRKIIFVSHDDEDADVPF